jgi:hypothetical protein
VKRLLALAAGVLGLRALLRRRPPREAAPVDDLRAKLAAARDLEVEREEFEGGEVPVDEAVDVETRRADVHARARKAIDDLGSSAP